MDDHMIEAGVITNTHGIRGEVKIEVWLDSPEFFKKFERILIKGKEYKILSSYIQKGLIIAKLDSITNIDEAIPLKGSTVYIYKADAKLKDGAFFLCEVIGADVFDESGDKIGVLKEIYESPAAPIFIVSGAEDHMIPAIPEFIMSTDVENKKIIVRLIEGM